MSREINTVGVVGLGTMGAGIVEVFARSGIDVVSVEITDAALERGQATMVGSIDRAVAKGKLTALERDEIFAR
ncbi:MAG TPA: 3-hydroxyacyl-CoA dehydrogenase NAD-binding domain-containing protein, partial [Asanoa sp.]|nr:3-hydroxyacyl-CoA dehydrogenase NAD-binding domain-containing protein [Asanoa sp.]